MVKQNQITGYDYRWDKTVGFHWFWDTPDDTLDDTEEGEAYTLDLRTAEVFPGMTYIVSKNWLPAGILRKTNTLNVIFYDNDDALDAPTEILLKDEGDFVKIVAQGKIQAGSEIKTVFTLCDSKNMSIDVETDTIIESDADSVKIKTEYTNIRTGDKHFGIAEMPEASESNAGFVSSTTLVSLQTTQTNITNEINEINSSITDINTQITNIDSSISSLTINDENLLARIDAETIARSSEDASLLANINNEASIRANADSSLQTQIDALANGPITDINTQITNIDNSISSLINMDGNLQTQIDALHGAVIYIGHISSSTSQITANTALLSQWAQANGYWPLRKGYCIVDSNANDWWWNDSLNEWINIGYYEVATATNFTKGLVMGNDVDLGVVVDAQGKMSVKNLQTALNSKVTANASITAATKTKITYDSKGLVTAGADLAESDIPTLSQSKIANLTNVLADTVKTIRWNGYAPNGGNGAAMTFRQFINGLTALGVGTSPGSWIVKCAWSYAAFGTIQNIGGTGGSPSLAGSVIRVDVTDGNIANYDQNSGCVAKMELISAPTNANGNNIPSSIYRFILHGNEYSPTYGVNPLMNWSEKTDPWACIVLGADNMLQYATIDNVARNKLDANAAVGGDLTGNMPSPTIAKISTPAITEQQIDNPSTIPGLGDGKTMIFSVEGLTLPGIGSACYGSIIISRRRDASQATTYQQLFMAFYVSGDSSTIWYRSRHNNSPSPEFQRLLTGSDISYFVGASGRWANFIADGMDMDIRRALGG